ncbi:hypothetical protein Bbelb_159550 [Branchiostoma belcheri]|nr:hypothetical protein Bbelb_159550 [Branchiostoma belcheri]
MDGLCFYLNDYVQKLSGNEGNGERRATVSNRYTGKECAYDNILILAIQKDGADTIDFYMLEDGVRLKDADSDSLAKNFDHSCCVTGSDNTYIVIENEKKFKKYLESQIVYCKNQIVPAMEAVRTKRQEYLVRGRSYSMYKHGEDCVQLRNNRDLRKIQNYSHNGEKVRGTPKWGKAHINGTGSDSLLIYVRQQYANFKVVVVYEQTIVCGRNTRSLRDLAHSLRNSEKGRRSLRNGGTVIPTLKIVISNGSFTTLCHTTKSASTQTELQEDVVNLSLEVERLSHKIRKMTKELDAHYKKFSDVFTKLGYLDPYSYDDEDNKVKEHLHGVWRSLYYDLDAWLGGPRRFEREKVAC